MISLGIAFLFLWIGIFIGAIDRDGELPLWIASLVVYATTLFIMVAVLKGIFHF